MIIAFVSNILSIRGTEVAMYDYAHYNEILLGNKSIIIAKSYELCENQVDCHIDVYNKFIKRFPIFYYKNEEDVKRIIHEQHVDITYIIKGGTYAGGIVLDRPYKSIVHCVFDTRQPHGTIYTPISDYLNITNNTSYPVLPHMIHIHNTSNNFRTLLGIPESAIVFGTYSGANQFNIEYIKNAVINISNDPQYDNIYFIFMNIIPFAPPNKHLLFLPGTPDLEVKRTFINTCDAMLYGRGEGETFGLSCGEFSICNKPVIACSVPVFYNTISRFHLDVLNDDAILHTNYNELYTILTNWKLYNKDVSNNGYKKYTPEYVMSIFKEMINSII